MPIDECNIMRQIYVFKIQRRRIIPKYIPEEPKWMSYYVASLVGNFDYSNNICVFQQGKYPLESNMIIRTADFKAIGGFNKNLPGVVGTMRIGGEGKDFFYRLQALGKKIYYHPGIIVKPCSQTQPDHYRVPKSILFAQSFAEYLWHRYV